MRQRDEIAALAVRATVGLAALKVATMAARASAVMVMVDRPDYASAPAVFQNRSLSATHSNFSSTTYKNMSDTMRGRGKRVVESDRAAEKARRAARREGIRAYHKAWREAHPEKWHAWNKAWREANPDKARASLGVARGEF
jgi:hypothetical protein